MDYDVYDSVTQQKVQYHVRPGRQRQLAFFNGAIVYRLKRHSNKRLLSAIFMTTMVRIFQTHLSQITNLKKF